MATDYAEKEREFVAALAEDTGRDLAAWMEAISSADLAHRNDIIDWLRQNGFTFSNASWLERIHHNGGRLVYGDDHPPPERMPVQQHKVAAPIAPPPVPPPLPEPAPVRAPPLPAAEVARVHVALVHTTAGAPPAPDIDAATAEVLLAAKGLRPLAMLAVQEIFRTIPEMRFEAQGPLVVMSAPKPFLALLPSAKALRFYGDFDRSGDSRAVRAEAAMKTASKAPPPFPSALVLTDARLVYAAFAALVKCAHTRAHN